MARLFGVNLPQEKKILYALTTIYGIGLTTAKFIIRFSKVSFDKKVCDLTISEIKLLRQTIEKNNIKVEGELKIFNQLNIQQLIDINCYRGRRHSLKLPVRGQRTKTNSRTNREIKKIKYKKKSINKSIKDINIKKKSNIQKFKKGKIRKKN